MEAEKAVKAALKDKTERGEPREGSWSNVAAALEDMPAFPYKEMMRAPKPS